MFLCLITAALFSWGSFLLALAATSLQVASVKIAVKAMKTAVSERARFFRAEVKGRQQVAIILFYVCSYVHTVEGIN